MYSLGEGYWTQQLCVYLVFYMPAEKYLTLSGFYHVGK